MNILHSESSVAWGGQENRTLNELITAKQFGHRTYLLCNPMSILGARAKKSGIEVFYVDMRGWRSFKSIMAIKKILTAQKITHANTHSSHDTHLVAIAARLIWRRPKVLRTRHLELPITSRFSYNYLVDRIIAVSNHVKRVLIANGVHESKIYVSHTGIDLQKFSPSIKCTTSIRNELSIPNTSVIVATVGILRGMKGHIDLIASIPKILSQFPNITFLIIGNGPSSEKIAHKIKELNLDSHVYMLGLRKDVPCLLQQSDIFFLPTRQEALGTAFIEASAMQKAVIGRNLGGIPEVIKDQFTGILIKDGSINEISKAIITLAQDSHLRNKLGINGRKFVMECFGIEQMTKKTLSIYEELDS